MSSHYPPLKCDEVIALLTNLGFVPEKQQGTSHVHYKRLSNKHDLLKVTVDCHKAPFSHELIKYMRLQAKLSKKDFYNARDKKLAEKIINDNYQ